MTRALAAAAALAIALAAVAQHEAVHDSFAAHMVQHLVLILVVAPLLAVATPATRVPRGPWATSVVSVVLLNTIVLWAWHLPVLYDAAVASDALHVVEHISFVATSWLFWLAVTRGGDHLKGAGIVFLVGLQSAALGALLTFASEPLFESHAGGSERLGLTALEDQQLAGGIMWVPPGIVYLVVTLVLLNAWMRRSGRPVTET
jgi:putative membrane protein